MYKILEGIDCPNDIKNLSIDELNCLSQEIRDFLIEKVSNTGGHLASNLGVVELTLALHKVFDSPKDKFIWDVGHQSYVHKILTGRKDMFDTLRQFEGLSGFPKESESEHDIFDTGHSSTSISAGVGIACARDIKHEEFNVISIIGDGAITGGMALEALNNLGYLKKDMTVIFNDNEMSIDKNTGALSTYMSNLHLDKCEFIDALGIEYIGPINGHNIEEIIETLKLIKSNKGPKFLHVKTVKGKGYEFAEQHPEKYHGVGKFNHEKGVKSSSKMSISSIVGKTLAEMADKNKKIVAITAAMPSGTGLNIFAENHIERYFDVGIAEQHAVTFAAGLAKDGLKPYFAVYSTFLQRGYDQLIHDVCITKKNVTFLIDRGGLVGNDGETHHGQFDLSYLNNVPNIVVMAPKDTKELVEMIRSTVFIDGPIAIRYPRGNEYIFNINDYNINIENNNNFTQVISKDSVGVPELIFKSDFNNADKSDLNGDNYRADVFEKDEIDKKLDTGKNILIISVGNMLSTVMEAIDAIDFSGEYNNASITVLNARYLKPLNENIYIDYLKNSDIVMTLEDNSIIGGFGSNIERLVCENRLKTKVIVVGIPDKFISHGDTVQLMDMLGLSPEKIRMKIKELI